MLRLKLTVLLCASVISAMDFNDCQSPDKPQGVCVSIKECPVLFSLIEEGKLTSITISYLRDAQCGFDGKIPKVCCPKNPPNNLTTTPTNNNQAANCLNNQTTNPPNNQTTNIPIIETTNPPNNQTTNVSINNQTTNSLDNQTTNPTIDQTTNPPNNQTTNSLDNQTTNPTIDQTTNPPNNQTTNFPNNQTTDPPNDETTNPPNDQTTNPPNNQTTNNRTSVGLNLLPSEETCGLSSTDKLLGGYLANLDEYPWTVLLMSRTEAYCGGTLINNRYVLTTGYCIQRNNLTMVRLGENDLTTNPDCVNYGKIKDCVEPYIDVLVEKTIVHEGYTFQAKTTINDIALIRLKKTVNYNDFIRPLCLPITDEVQNKNYTNKFITRVGWGTIHKGNLNSQKMKQPVTVLENEECNKRYPLNLTKKQLCTVTRGDRQCIGDIGGAVCDYRIDTGTYYAVGITSGASCTLDHPAVYTKVSEYMDWILSHLEE